MGGRVEAVRIRRSKSWTAAGGEDRGRKMMLRVFRRWPGAQVSVGRSDPKAVSPTATSAENEYWPMLT